MRCDLSTSALEHEDAREDGGARPAFKLTERRGGDGEKIKVLTYNLKAAHGPEKLGKATPEERERNLCEVAAYVNRVDPDVALFQEVEQNRNRNGPYSMFDRLTRMTEASDAQFSDESLGVAVVTRNGFEIADGGAGSNLEVSHRVGQSSALAVPVIAPASGESFTVVTAHVSPETLPGFVDQHIAPIAKETLAPGFPSRFIVGGDFNASTKKVEAQLGRAAETRSMLDGGWPSGRGPATNGSRDFDQIHTSAGFGPAQGGQVDRPIYGLFSDHVGRSLSDHQPAHAETTLEKTAEASE